MQASEIAALPVRLGAAIRHRRLFHPAGVFAKGRLERVAPADEGLPMSSCNVVARVSKGIGLPDGWPDIAGLAWRIPPRLQPAPPWDVLLASTIPGRWGRVILSPATSWSNVTFSTLMPLRYEGGVWWARARVTTEIDAQGLSLDVVRDQITSGGIDFDIEQAAGTGDFLPLARLTLHSVDQTNRDIAFDPTLNSAPGVTLLPGWLNDFRRAAYRRSRQGRDAE